VIPRRARRKRRAGLGARLACLTGSDADGMRSMDGTAATAELIDWNAVGEPAAALLSRYVPIDTTTPPGNEAPAAWWFRLVARGTGGHGAPPTGNRSCKLLDARERRRSHGISPRSLRSARNHINRLSRISTPQLRSPRIEPCLKTARSGFSICGPGAPGDGQQDRRSATRQSLLDPGWSGSRPVENPPRDGRFSCNCLLLCTRVDSRFQ
jgi:hypothetical protein